MFDHSILSPSGRVSKRAERLAKARATAEIFRDFGGHVPFPQGPEQQSERERLLRQAGELRELAARGMKPRAYLKKAIELERQA